LVRLSRCTPACRDVSQRLFNDGDVRRLVRWFIGRRFVRWRLIGRWIIRWRFVRWRFVRWRFVGRRFVRGWVIG
jgi:hypothetical protein